MIKGLKVVYFCIIVLLAFAFFNTPGVTDVGIWMRWLGNLEDHGLIDGYRAHNADYPPLSSMILFLVLQVAKLGGLEHFVALKISLYIFYAATVSIFYLWAREWRITVFAALALMLSSILHGYIDIYYAPSLILSLWALQRKKLLSFAVFFIITIFIKWQAVIIAPFVFLYIIQINHLKEWRHVDVKKLLWNVVLPSFAISFLLLLIFQKAMTTAFLKAMSHNYLSGKAMNLSWIITYVLHVLNPAKYGELLDGIVSPIRQADLKITLIPKLLFIISYMWTFVMFFRRQKKFPNLIIYSIMGYFCYYIFNTGVHENHLFVVMLLALMQIRIDPSMRDWSLLMILIANLNPFLFYGIHGHGLPFDRVFFIDISVPFSVLNVILFALGFASFVLKVHKTNDSLIS